MQKIKNANAGADKNANAHAKNSIQSQPINQL